jgi:hypothetical protein
MVGEVRNATLIPTDALTVEVEIISLVDPGPRHSWYLDLQFANLR